MFIFSSYSPLLPSRFTKNPPPGFSGGFLKKFSNFSSRAFSSPLIGSAAARRDRNTPHRHRGAFEVLEMVSIDKHRLGL
jgi:hypothetical protein